MSRSNTPLSASTSTSDLSTQPPAITTNAINSAGPGAAQFINNLNERQLQHLQFNVPASQRLSQYLDAPRSVPVPKRFTFDALNAASRRQKIEEEKGEGEPVEGTRIASASSSNFSTPSLDFLKDVTTERVREVFEVVDWRFYITASCICLLNLVTAWDATALSIALPTIATMLNGSAFDTFWLGISFLVAATAFVPLFTVFSDIFGRKAMILTAVVFFTAGSILCAVAKDFGILHIGRSIQGVGAGGFCMLSDLIVSDLLSPVDRRRWSTLMGTVWAIGAITGPIIGEALLQHRQWRWLFWLHLPFCGVAFPVLAFVAQLRPASQGTVLSKLRTTDWVGILLLSSSLVSLFLGISWGGTEYAWSAYYTILPIQFGAIGLIAFCVWSWYSPFPSLINLDGLLDRTSLATYCGAAVLGMVVTAFLYFMPFFFIVAKPAAGQKIAGLRFFPWTISLVVFILIAFIIITKWSCWLQTLWLGWFLVTLGIGLTCTWTSDSSTAHWVCIAIILGSGVGLLYPSLHTVSDIIASHEEDEKPKHAVTNFLFFHLLGKTMGVAIATSIFQNRLLTNLQKSAVFSDFAEKYAKNSVALAVKLKFLAGGDSSANLEIEKAYVDSLRVVWIVMAVMAGLALVASCFMVRRQAKREDGLEIEGKVIEGGYVV